LEAGLSQEDLAERARISAAGIGALERGDRRTPQRETIALLANALGLDPTSRRAFEDAAKPTGRLRLGRGSVTTGPSRTTSSSNLPLTLTTFVGRESDLADIATLLSEHRLVTLTGAGGSGKTRTALEVGAARNAAGDDVYFVDLAPFTDASLVVPAIASALGVKEVPNRPLLEVVLAFIERQRLLVVLDNCEHVIDDARSLAATLLHRCAGVRILATSREALNIAGERTHQLSSLPLEVAVALFTDRADAAAGRFTVTDENAGHVAKICKMLDGMPLALELAAARVSMFTPQDLVDKLDDRFRLLTGGDPTAPPRQRTLRALIDWSYELLSEDERSLFRVLCTFAGGFTFESAIAVYGRVSETDGAAFDLLASLVNKSLVQVERTDGRTRYRLLESTQHYARDRLRESGEVEAAARAHAEAVLELALDLHDGYEQIPDSEWNAVVVPELENWRAALAWSFGERGDVELARRIVCALRWAWNAFTPGERWQWVRTALQTVDVATPAAIVARLHLIEALHYKGQGMTQASYDAAERAFVLAKRAVDEREVAQSEWRMGDALITLGRVEEGARWVRSGLAVLGQSDAPKTRAWMLLALGMANFESGNHAGAKSSCTEALTIAREHGFGRIARIALSNLAELEFQTGDAQAALALAEDALARTQVGSRHEWKKTLANMAVYLLALGRYAEARSRAREALDACRAVGAMITLAYAQQHLAAVAAHRPAESEAAALEDRARGARLLGYVDGRLAALGAPREATEVREHSTIVAALTEALGAGLAANLMQEGRAWSEERAFAEALLV
jgi:predicted ATPase/DNA-binding XRE family transcriptional regulator